MLRDFHLLDHFSKWGTITCAILSNNSDLLGSFRLWIHEQQNKPNKAERKLIRAQYNLRITQLPQKFIYSLRWSLFVLKNKGFSLTISEGFTELCEEEREDHTGSWLFFYTNARDQQQRYFTYMYFMYNFRKYCGARYKFLAGKTVERDYDYMFRFAAKWVKNLKKKVYLWTNWMFRLFTYNTELIPLKPCTLCSFRCSVSLPHKTKQTIQRRLVDLTFFFVLICCLYAFKQHIFIKLSLREYHFQIIMPVCSKPSIKYLLHMQSCLLCLASDDGSFFLNFCSWHFLKSAQRIRENGKNLNYNYIALVQMSYKNYHN